MRKLFSAAMPLVLFSGLSTLALSGCGSSHHHDDFTYSPVNGTAAGTSFAAARGAGFESATITTSGGLVTGETISPSTGSATLTSNGSGTGFTFNLPADASSSGIADTANVPYASFTNTNQAVFPNGSQQASVTTTNGQTLTVNRFGASQNLSYSEYGTWLEPGAINSAAPTTVAAFAIGLPTASIPTTGTATYTGGATGIAANTIGGTTTVGQFAGTTNMTANFAANTISGNITSINFSNSNSSGAIGGTMNDIAMTGGTISGNTFSGNTVSAGATAGTGLNISGANTGRFGGQFNGPNAQEVAGTFQLAGGANNAKVIGSFGAKQ